MADRADGITTPRSRRKRLRVRWQVKWMVTVAGALAMVIIAGVLIWNVVTAPNPLAELVPGLARTAERGPTSGR
jgi:hypothetical protein